MEKYYGYICDKSKHGILRMEGAQVVGVINYHSSYHLEGGNSFVSDASEYFNVPIIEKDEAEKLIGQQMNVHGLTRDLFVQQEPKRGRIGGQKAIFVGIDMGVVNPCDEEYDQARVKKLFGKRRKTLNALNILKLDIPYFDILWAVLDTKMTPEHIIRTFIYDCAEHLLPLIPGPKRRTLRALIEHTSMIYDDGGDLLRKDPTHTNKLLATLHAKLAPRLDDDNAFEDLMYTMWLATQPLGVTENFAPYNDFLSAIDSCLEVFKDDDEWKERVKKEITWQKSHLEKLLIAENKRK